MPKNVICTGSSQPFVEFRHAISILAQQRPKTRHANYASCIKGKDAAEEYYSFVEKIDEVEPRSAALSRSPLFVDFCENSITLGNLKG
ncbi:MAG: hypothetical protein JO235_03625 [Chroococcidiopsidaceae cyanobacterium CP_BM_RX_35]|nr:hypothetical protein [Chroococcidiopsidaceae cyanobacterium CP_BM_RX_35]